MDTEKKMERVLLLNAGISSVWDMLINPTKTKQYMFNCKVQSDWTQGSAISWKGNYQGYESGEKGIVLIFDKGEKLKYTSIDPTFGIEDTPINYLHVTYSLKPIENKTELTIIVENFNDNKERIKHVARGWDDLVIPAIVKLLEQSN